ncbi:MAG: NAD(P)-dependent alcohol dehydrogenase [Gammaproteobacteria bacterium]|nr:NAD(P)-dependent alcohol dehydrogenase [Gammaproteobacteria bacterium]
MKAVKYRQYGPAEVLTIEDTEKPAPKANEVLIKIKAASATRADTMMRRGAPYLGRIMLGLLRPKYQGLGTGFAGVIEAKGSAVTHFDVGDAVFGESIFGSGTNAEYVCVPEDGIMARKPANLSFEETCFICDGPLTSLNFLRDVAKLKAGQRVLIIGASGSLGSAAVQLANHFGAHVTAVCSSANAVWVKSLGVDRVIDYAETDFTQEYLAYEVIFDTVGKSSFRQCKGVLSENGLYLSPVFSFGDLFQMFWTRFFSRKKALFSATGLRARTELRDMLHELNAMLESGRLQSIIDRRYELTNIVSAHHYIDEGHKKGNVVIVM